MADARADVLGIGNAIVDVLTHAEDSFIEKHGLEKGAMMLIDSGGRGFEAVQSFRHDGIKDDGSESSSQTEKPSQYQAYVNARTAGVDAPTAFERDVAALNVIVVLIHFVAGAERGIAAGVVAVGLAWLGARHKVGQSDRRCLPQGLQEMLRMTGPGLAFGIA